MTALAIADNLLPEGFAPDPARPSGPSWLEARRMRAMKNFRAGGVPHRRIEEWKYTDLRAALEARREAADRDAALLSDRDPFAAVANHRLIVGNGRLDAARSQPGPLPAGVAVFDLAALDDHAPDWVTQNLGEVLSDGAMGQASLALMQGGVALRVTTRIDAPIHLRFLQDQCAVHGRVLIVIEEGASLVLLESHRGDIGLTDLGCEFVLHADAQLTHVRLADAAPNAIQIEEIGVRVSREGRYRGHFLQKGAKLSRLEIAISLQGERAEAEVSGSSALGEDRHADVTTHIDHIAERTASRQLFKNVAGGRARAVYQGKITVRKGADGSDSRQTAKALLLSARAEADLKPELEILADDVKCAHGAAVGDLDPDALFYLRSRGLPEGEARKLLIQGFLEDAVAEIASPDIRRMAWQFLESGLAQALEAEA
jgi:Fe-S cluster assembly protein SufD